MFDFSVHPILEMAEASAIQTVARPELEHMRSFSTPYTDGLGRLWNFSIDFQTGVYVISGAAGTFSAALHPQTAIAMRHEAHQLELARWCRKNPGDLIGCTESRLMPLDWGLITGIIGIVISGIISYWSYNEGNDSDANINDQFRRLCDSSRYTDSVRQTQLANECRSQGEGRSDGWVFCRARPVFVEQAAVGNLRGGECAASLQFLRCDVECETLDPYGPLPE